MSADTGERLFDEAGSVATAPPVESAASAAPQPSATTPWKLRHYPGLDGLRGLAVLGVIAFHASEAGSVSLLGGYLGVDLFFVLSGFLITSLLLGERRDTDGIKLGHFWGARA